MAHANPLLQLWSWACPDADAREAAQKQKTKKSKTKTKKCQSKNDPDEFVTQEQFAEYRQTAMEKLDHACVDNFQAVTALGNKVDRNSQQLREHHSTIQELKQASEKQLATVQGLIQLSKQQMGISQRRPRHSRSRR